MNHTIINVKVGTIEICSYTKEMNSMERQGENANNKREVFYFDSHDYPKANVPPPNEMLGDFLESDIQNDKKLIEELKERCEQSNNLIKPWKLIGNAYKVTIKKGNPLEIESLHTHHPALKIDKDSFLRYLDGWKKLISILK